MSYTFHNEPKPCILQGNVVSHRQQTTPYSTCKHCSLTLQARLRALLCPKIMKLESRFDSFGSSAAKLRVPKTPSTWTHVSTIAKSFRFNSTFGSALTTIASLCGQKARK